MANAYRAVETAATLYVKALSSVGTESSQSCAVRLTPMKIATAIAVQAKMAIPARRTKRSTGAGSVATLRATNTAPTSVLIQGDAATDEWKLCARYPLVISPCTEKTPAIVRKERARKSNRVS